jgi:hypothetical protein
MYIYSSCFRKAAFKIDFIDGNFLGENIRLIWKNYFDFRTTIRVHYSFSFRNAPVIIVYS